MNGILIALSLVMTLVSISGCNFMYADYWQLNSERVRVTERAYAGKPGFAITVAPEDVAQFGGPKTVPFRNFISEELRKRRLCPSGYEIRSEVSSRESYFISGVCN